MKAFKGRDLKSEIILSGTLRLEDFKKLQQLLNNLFVCLEIIGEKGRIVQFFFNSIFFQGFATDTETS